ncbi:MAG: hypothetical protein ACJ757_12930 [Gaiellaceae bacterium]
MTQTRTLVRTLTFTRTDFLVRQIDFVVRETTSSSSFEAVMRRGAENEWIAAVKIQGLTSSNKIAEELRFSFDWNEHRLQIESGNGVIHVDPRVPEGEWMAHAIGLLINDFNEIRDDGSLRATWTLEFTPKAWADIGRVMRELGLRWGGTRDWVGGTEGEAVVIFSPSGYPDVSVALRVATA